jgi:SPX domain
MKLIKQLLYNMSLKVWLDSHIRIVTLLGTMADFHPKILLTFHDNLAVSANISPETKKVFEDLMNHRANGKSQKISESKNQPADHPVLEDYVDDVKDRDDDIFQTDEDIAQSQRAYDKFREGHRQNNDRTFEESANKTSHSHTIEITLRADSEFFKLLTNELSSIDHLQARQKEILTSQVTELGKEVSAVTKPSKSSEPDLYAWRKIFELYRDASVFFATTEREHGARNSEQARERVQWFSNQLQAQNLVCNTIRSRLIADPQIQE